MVGQPQTTLLELDARLAGIVRGLGAEAFRPIWPAVALMAVSDVKNNFAGGHGPDGTPWTPLPHGRPGQESGAKPLRDTGVLMASIQGRADGDGIAVGTNLAYAAIHQFGGTIRPTKAKFLAIPLTVQAKRAGGPRQFPGNPAWDFIPTRTGGWLMVAAPPPTAGQRRRGQRPAAEAQYLLVNEVTIPARPFLGFSDKLIHRVGQMITDRALSLVGGALGLSGASRNPGQP